MPNDCNNYFTITDITHNQWRDLAATFQVRGEGYQQDFLKTFYPEPDYSITPVAKTYPEIDAKHAKCEEERAQILKNEPTIREDSWWDWRVQNWGTKWDVYSCCNDWENEVPSDEFSVGFCTASSPPSEECMAVISQRFPGSLLINYYQESGIDFFGVTLAKNGVGRDMCDSMISKYQEIFIREQLPNLDSEFAEEGLHDEDDQNEYFWDNYYEDFYDYIHRIQESFVQKFIQEIEEETAQCLVST